MLLFLGFKSTDSVTVSVSFFERNVFCVHYCRGRERRKVFPTDYAAFHLPGNNGAIQTFSTFATSASSSLATSFSPCCQSAPVFNFHRSSCSCSSLTIDKMKYNYHQYIHLRRENSPLNTLNTAMFPQFNVL